MKTGTYTVKICDKDVEIRKTRATAIKAYCTDCSYGTRTEVVECPCKQCPLYPFRGFVQWKQEKREYTEEERAAIGSRLKEALSKKSASPV